MEKSTIILNELREISLVLADMNIEIPYKVPQGYFEELASQVMLKIAIEEKASVDPVLNINKENIYKVPQGYFEELASQVMLKIAIEEKASVDPVLNINKENIYQVPPGYFEGLAAQVILRIAIEEKASADPVLNINNENIYEVPPGYFEGLAGTILNRIKETEATDAKEELELLSPALSQIEKKNPFSSPEGYFEEFSDNVVAGVQAIEFVNEELENLSPVMSSLKENNVYEVPQQYFEKLPAEILNKVNHQPAKVVPISFAKKIMRYAAAAVIIGVMAVGAYKVINPSVAPVIDPGPGIAKATEQELENFLNTNTISLADTTTVISAEISEDDTKDLLADVSDEELQKYLEQHGGTSNSITN
jgi:hypothetical protein